MRGLEAAPGAGQGKLEVREALLHAAGAQAGLGQIEAQLTRQLYARELGGALRGLQEGEGQRVVARSDRALARARQHTVAARRILLQDAGGQVARQLVVVVGPRARLVQQRVRDPLVQRAALGDGERVEQCLPHAVVHEYVVIAGLAYEQARGRGAVERDAHLLLRHARHA